MRIAVAMSGGVDSSVAACLLKEQGHDLIGFFMRSGIQGHGEGAKRSCCSASDARDAAHVASQLSIPFYSLNIADGFARLLDYFSEEYRAGRTPSPCVHCNGWLKFGTLLASARECGAERVATGHYARVSEDEAGGGRRLLRAVDRSKDQSYFLFSLTREQLASVCFPLGELTKKEVRAVARRAGLCVQDKPESQELCFAPGGNYAEVVERVSGVATAPGPVVDEHGVRIGTHKGTVHYTIGQRRGLGIPLGEPKYVVAIDPETNTVVLGSDSDLWESKAWVTDVHWIGEAPAPGDSRKIRAQIRYRHAPSDAVVRVEEGDRATVRFAEPQRAFAPGQALVFSRGDEVLGGGWIERKPESDRGDRSSARGFRDPVSNSFPV